MKRRKLTSFVLGMDFLNFFKLESNNIRLNRCFACHVWEENDFILLYFQFNLNLKLFYFRNSEVNKAFIIFVECVTSFAVLDL